MNSDEVQILQLLSVVVPAYNEELGIRNFAEQMKLLKVELSKTGLDTEVILVNDGSIDMTETVAIQAFDSANIQSKVITLLGNVGAHKAIRCGLEHASGQAIAILSSDGQDPISVIPEMLKKLNEGNEIIWGKRIDRKNDGFVSRSLATLFYRFFGWISKNPIPDKGLDFVLFSEKVSVEIRKYTDRNLPFHLTLFNLGFDTTYVAYDRMERTTGKSKWTLRKKCRLAIDMLTYSSLNFLRLVIMCGALIATSIFGLGITAFFMPRLLEQSPIFRSLLICALATTLMIIFAAFAIIGEYLWRTLDESRNRPLFSIKRIWENESR
jgi:polyisoprenyl-phosphate glycosyltransferase